MTHVTEKSRNGSGASDIGGSRASINAFWPLSLSCLLLAPGPSLSLFHSADEPFLDNGEDGCLCPKSVSFQHQRKEAFFSDTSHESREALMDPAWVLCPAWDGHQCWLWLAPPEPYVPTPPAHGCLDTVMTPPLGPQRVEEEQLSKSNMVVDRQNPHVLQKDFCGLALSICPAPPKIFL